MIFAVILASLARFACFVGVYGGTVNTKIVGVQGFDQRGLLFLLNQKIYENVFLPTHPINKDRPRIT